MKNYFILDGHKEIGPFNLDMIKDQGITPDSLIRLQNSSYWIAAGKIAELKEFIVVPEADNKSKTSLQKIKSSGKSATAKKIYRLSVPVLIALAIGSTTIFMGSFMIKKNEQLSDNAFSPAHMPLIPDAEKTYQPQSLKERESDSIALNGNASSKVYLKVVQGSQPDLKLHEDRAEFYRKNWSKYMVLNNTSYKRGLLGGIKGLMISFTNNSDYPVDEVIAEITYIKSNGKTWKTKLVPIRNIAPHTEKPQGVPNVNRSRTVRISIKEIKASQLRFTYKRDKDSSFNATTFYWH